MVRSLVLWPIYVYLCALGMVFINQGLEAGDVCDAARTRSEDAYD
jgi:hypothetical protein